MLCRSSEGTYRLDGEVRNWEADNNDDPNDTKRARHNGVTQSVDRCYYLSVALFKDNHPVDHVGTYEGIATRYVFVLLIVCRDMRSCVVQLPI